MSITSVATYKTSLRNILLIQKNSASWGGGLQSWFSAQLAGGSPAATTAPANTANGIKPSSPSTGYPTIPPYTGTAYITGVEFTALTSNYNSAASPYVPFFRWMLADVLWYAGAYDATSNVTLSAQPSYSARIPGGTDYTGLQIWTEGTTGSSGGHQVTITYTNDAGATGKTTPLTDYNPSAASNVGFQAVRVPLAAGDRGVQKIEKVVGTGAAGYSFNVMVLREVAHGACSSYNISSANRRQRRWMEAIGMPQIYSDSCLVLFTISDFGNQQGTSFPMEIAIEVAAG